MGFLTAPEMCPWNPGDIRDLIGGRVLADVITYLKNLKMNHPGFPGGWGEGGGLQPVTGSS